MDMGKILEDSFKFPVSNWKRLLIFGLIILVYEISLQVILRFLDISIGLLLFIIPVIICYLLMTGYQLRAIGNTAKGEDEPPIFNKWGQMIIDGLKVLIVALIYGFVPGIIFGLGILLLTVSSTMRIIGLAVILIALLLMIIMNLILMMALPNMAYDEDLSAALRLGEIKGKIKKLGLTSYIIIFILAMIFMGIFALVSMLVALIPYIGLFLASLILLPYSNLFTARVYGLVYKETIDDEPQTRRIEDTDFPVNEHRWTN
ncbi:MAG: DUF4013 domain-containing protein [Methanothermobacter sp.]